MQIVENKNKQTINKYQLPIKLHSSKPVDKEKKAYWRHSMICFLLLFQWWNTHNFLQAVIVLLEYTRWFCFIAECFCFFLRSGRSLSYWLTHGSLVFDWSNKTQLATIENKSSRHREKITQNECIVNVIYNVYFFCRCFTFFSPKRSPRNATVKTAGRLLRDTEAIKSCC